MKKSLFLFFLLPIHSFLLAQDIGVVRGEVFDENGLLPGVEIIVSGRTISSDADGAFAIKLQPGDYNFAFHFPAYKTEKKDLTISENEILDLEIEMFPATEPDALSERSKINLYNTVPELLIFLQKYIFRISH